MVAGHARTFDELAIGEEFPPLHVDVTPDHINGFQVFLGHFDDDDDAGSFLQGSNLHVDEEYSRRNMFGGVVGDAHQTIQYCCQVVTDALAPGALVSGYSSLDIKLTNPTRPGDHVVATAKVVDKVVEDGRNLVVCSVMATKQGDRVVAVGTITAHMPD